MQNRIVSEEGKTHLYDKDGQLIITIEVWLFRGKIWLENINKFVEMDEDDTIINFYYELFYKFNMLGLLRVEQVLDLISFQLMSVPPAIIKSIEDSHSTIHFNNTTMSMDGVASIILSPLTHLVSFENRETLAEELVSRYVNSSTIMKIMDYSNRIYLNTNTDFKRYYRGLPYSTILKILLYFDIDRYIEDLSYMDGRISMVINNHIKSCQEKGKVI